MINNEIIKLYKDYELYFNGLLPMLYGNLKLNSILYIGLNPSFSPENNTFRKVLRDTKYHELSLSADNYYNFFKEELTFDKIESVKQIQSYYKERYPYFSKFMEIADSANLSWEHVDLFQTRVTIANNLLGLTDHNYVQKSSNILNQLVELIQPKIIIVENTKVRDILRNLDENMFPYNIHNQIGTPINNKGVPIFYTSMFTGQRALDNGSYLRLKWHVKYILERI